MSAWTWVYLDVAATPIGLDEPTPAFQCQADAESWIGENWRELVAQGVDAVTLTEGDQTIYGPMSLRPAN